MKIAIIGTRGIPNQYGGFEQLAEYLSLGLVNKGHEVFVYNSHNHVFKPDMWNDVHIIHCYDPEKNMGTAGQFIYDLNCVLDARKRKFDVLLILGYTSISVWGRLFPRKAVTVINMDGLEWKRTKYSAPVQKFLRYAEGLAVKCCNYFIADSTAIQSYLKDKYGIASEYIAYGAELLGNEEESLLTEFKVVKYDYFMVMARMEPENNIETILDGFSASDSRKRMLVIGNTGNTFGRHVTRKFRHDQRIHFAGPIYHAKTVHTLKTFSSLYFHGHSVGGTNPSLLEAMASRALIAAHDNPFNKAILGEDALYFSGAQDVKNLVENAGRRPNETDKIADKMIGANLRKVIEKYSWDRITDQYAQCIDKSYQEFNKLKKS